VSREDDLYRRAEEMARESRKKARKEKWAKWEKNFWRTFLFTENGKPKSGLMVYTFCLSFVFLGVYIAAFCAAIETLTVPLAALPVFWGNLLQSAAAGAAGTALSALLHFLLPDKRLALGAHLWLVLYAAASAVTLSVMLAEREAILAMLVFFGWFVMVPLAMGLAATYLLYRRDCRPAEPREEEPEWKKYLRPR